MFFSAVSDKLSADRTALAGQKANLETVVERLEDAVAIFNGAGELRFANPAMRALCAAEGSDGRRRSAWRELVQKTLAIAPVAWTGVGPRPRGGGRTGQRVAGQHARRRRRRPAADRRHADGRNLDALANVQSTLRYSSKLTALGRLSAGVAHEVKNPLNAMMIHLELFRQKLSGVRPALRVPARAQRAAPTERAPSVAPWRRRPI